MLHNSSKAIKNFVKAEKIYNLYYKEDDSIYIFSKLGLWKTYEQIEQYNLAQKNMDIVVQIAKLTLKNNMKSAFLFQLSQAELWPTLKSSGSLPYWRNALKTNEILFGNDHYQYARYSYLLAQALANSNLTKDAVIYYRNALRIMNKQLITHPSLTQYHQANLQKIKSKLEILENLKN